jgi:hypothetical protein
MTPQLVNIEDLQIVSIRQPDPSVVSDYAEAMEEGAKFPPIKVYQQGETLFCADGAHRVSAASTVGFVTIEAEIQSGTHADALRYALKANCAHGHRRTNADKRKAVEVAFKSRNELGLPDNPSDRVIADLCGVSVPLAGKIREQLSTVDSSLNGPRAGADGKVRQSVTQASDGGEESGEDAGEVEAPRKRTEPDPAAVDALGDCMDAKDTALDRIRYIGARGDEATGKDRKAIKAILRGIHVEAWKICDGSRD